VPLAVGGLLLVGGSVGAWAATSGDDGGHWRTSTVGTADVEQTLDLTGTVSAVTDAEAAFGVAGTVSSVAVEVGDVVTAGQRLATLDGTGLQRAVTKAAADLETAEAALESASTSTSTGTTGSATTPRTSTATPTTSPAASTPTSTPAVSTPVDTTKERKAVNAAQTKVDAARTTATQALATQATACEAVLGAPAAEPTTSVAPTVTPSATPDPSASPTATESTEPETTPAGSDGQAADLARCIEALQAVQAAQQDVQVEQADLDEALTALARALATPAAPATTGTGGAGSDGATPVPSGATDSTGSATADTGGSGVPSAGTGRSGGTSPKVAVLQAQAALLAARTDLAAAVLVAPLSGTVAAVPYAVGDDVTATDAITIVGTGAVRVTVQVPLATLPSARVGQVAQVTAAGATEPVGGTVESIGLLPTSTTSATYPVVVLVPTPPGALATGSSAGVSIVLASADDVVAVPSSALTTLGSRKAVTLAKDGKAVLTPVETGAVGPLLVQVTSGVVVGDEVVLADLDAALPASSGETTTRPGAGTARTFGGGSGPVGGMPPGGR
jgi:multidrug efflux pump subunit AcrA (membrane-fusion protein)